jgi:peptide/nickel transport system permease protein
VLIYIGRRMAMAVSVILVTLVATFVLFYVGPSDPARSICGDQRCTPERLTDIRHSLHLDDPVTTQFADYFEGLFVGRTIVNGGFKRECSAPCLGYSFRTDQDVKSQIFSRFPATLSLALGAMVIFLAVGVGTGVAAARRRGTRMDRFVVGGSQVFGSIPYYILALLFALYFTILYPILPRSGYNPLFTDGPVAWASGLLAPWLILGLTTATGYTRYARASMIESMAQDYVRTGRSKGISERRVVYRHALRAAMSPVLTILGLDMAALLSGTLITEQIFEIDGIGRLSLQSLRNDDLPIIMGTVLVAAAMVVLMNLVVDVAYSFLDPRVRLT